MYLFIALFLDCWEGVLVEPVWFGLSFVISFEACSRDLLRFEYDGIWLLLLQGYGGGDLFSELISEFLLL